VNARNEVLVLVGCHGGNAALLVRPNVLSVDC
jgi:hypothetical protein